jgi:hypothetical protein
MRKIIIRKITEHKTLAEDRNGNNHLIIHHGNNCRTKTATSAAPGK